ncbi:MAG: peptidoglycan DD-metalloendopeptidase family protein [Burkholderiaceae bacterium]
MKRRPDPRTRAADGIASAPSARGRGARAGLVLIAMILAACAGPRAPAPITHRAPMPVPPPAPAQVAVIPPATEAAGAGQGLVPGEQAAASGVEAAPIMAGRVETRPLGGSLPLPPAATEEIRQEPSGLKHPYSDETYARLAAVPMQGKRPIENLASASPSAAAPASAAATPAPAAAAPATMVDTGKFAWPVKGRLIQRFTDPASMGIAIEAAQGSAVHAAEAGRVIFSGPGPRGYGNLVIVKHPDELLSVYAHNSRILVKEGQNVTRGQKIAEVGASGTSSARLGFEVRRDGKPIDPLGFLAGG